MYEPCPEGPWKGKVAADVFDTVLDEYYEWRGWDKQTGLQTRSKLEELGLGDVAEVLAAEKALIEDGGKRSVQVSVPSSVEKMAK
jgi:aldehyde:ferredoxin oxidoreductase